MSKLRIWSTTVLASLVLISCGPAGSGGPATGQQAGQAPAAPKRLTSVVLGDVGWFSGFVRTGQGTVPGQNPFFALVNSGLTVANLEGVYIPLIGTEVPSTAAGTWRVFPDGRMETTHTIRAGARWHDGTPVTSEDLVFSVKVGLDTGLGLIRQPAFNSVESAEAVDGRTAVVRWKSPFISADRLFGSTDLTPAHILEAPFQARAPFLELPHWGEEFIGTGPFKLREWVRNSHSVMEAFDGYVLGRAKIDILEVKYITDPNTVIANVLAGAIDVVLGGILSFEQVLDVVGRWPQGHMWSGGGNNSVIYSQFIDPNPPIIAHPQFRRALLMATNRRELLDTFQKGQGTISHTTVFAPDQPELAAVDRYIVKWPYDPRQAQETLQSIGYSKGSDGALVDASGQKLPTLELRTITREPQSKMVLVIADNWKQVGGDTQTHIIPDQRANEAEYRATYPAFQLLNANTGFERFNMNQIPLPPNYRGENRSRYADPEVTRLGELYFVTIPFAERMDVAGQAIRKLTDEVVVFPLMIRVDANLIANRVKNVEGNGLWNVHEWVVD